MPSPLQRTLLGAMICLLLLLATLGPAADAEAVFRPAFVADQVVKLWFHEQRGAKVHHILARLSRQELIEIFQLVEEHPEVQEIRDNSPDERSVRLYQGLLKTFQDILNNK